MARKQLPTVTILSLCLATTLGACGNGQQLEGFLRPNPNLESPTSQNQEQQEATDSSTIQSTQNQEANSQSPGIQITKRPKPDPDDNSSETVSTQEVAELPENLPFYPQATLETITSDSSDERGTSMWRSQDELQTILNYYQEKWQSENWQVIEPFDPTEDQQGYRAKVSKDEMEYELVLVSVSEDDQQQSKLTIGYEPAQESAFANAQNTEEVALDSKQAKENNSSSQGIDSNLLSDLAETPETLQKFVAEVAALNIVTFKAKDSNNKLQFQPNSPITRGQYAKWLVKANNKYYANFPGKKIRLASATNSNPAFKDVTSDNPYYPEIQGLAEAGLIPSVLTNDSTQVLFKPNAPLSREDLISWKAPLDSRKGLINADSNAIKETWGFQDLSKISPEAFPALFADYQNGDRSNIKRVFGYTTLLQPQKTVTRAEAATSLWFIGSQEQGITATEALQINQ